MNAVSFHADIRLVQYLVSSHKKHAVHKKLNLNDLTEVEHRSLENHFLGTFGWREDRLKIFEYKLDFSAQRKI